MRIGRREDEGRSAVEAIFPSAQYDGRDVLRPTGGAIVASCFATIDHVGIEWIRRDIAILLNAHRVPIRKRDFAEVAAAGGAYAAAFLLSAVYPIRKLIVSDHVVELGSWLVVPGTPGRTAIDADGGALIARQGDDVGILWIDPNSVVVVATGSTFNRSKSVAGVVGTVGGSVGDEDAVGLRGMNAHPREVVASPIYALLVVHPLPTLASVVRAIDTTSIRGLHHRVHATGIARGNGDANAAKILAGGQAFG